MNTRSTLKMKGRLRVVVTVALAILLALACAKPEPKVDTAAQEAKLRETLTTIRGAIKAFHAANGRYPHSLDELVPAHLPTLPVDPLTGSATTWVTTTEETVETNTDFIGNATAARSVIIDVRSGAGAPWSNW